MSIHQLLRIWNANWFLPQSPLPMAVFRILLGISLIQYSVLLLPELPIWFGEKGLISSETATQIISSPHINVFTWLPPYDSSVQLIFCVLLVAAIGITFGSFTRISLIVGYACLVSLNLRNTLITNGGDVFMAIALFLLIFSDAGAALSFDRLRLIRNSPWLDFGPPRYSWPVAQRLMQIQISVVYFQAFWSKMAGAPWLDGTAVYWVLHEQEYLHFPVPFIPDQLWLCQLLTWATLLIEFSMWTFVWIKEFRYPVLVAAVFLHLGIDYALNLPIFETIMIFSFILFVAPEDIEKICIRVRTTLFDPDQKARL